MTRVIGWPDLPFRESYDDDHKGRTCPYLSGLNVWFRGVATRQRGRGTPERCRRRRRRRLAGSPASGPRARASASCRWYARPRAASCRWHPAPRRSLPCPCPGDFLFPEKEKKKPKLGIFIFFPLLESMTQMGISMISSSYFISDYLFIHYSLRFWDHLPEIPVTKMVR